MNVECSICGTAMVIRRGQYAEGQRYVCSMRCLSLRQSKANLGRGEPYSRGQGGKRADLGGLYLRSRWEANWARYLNLLVALGAIREWTYEPETFEFPAITRGSRFYTPDFRIVNPDGSIEYHEVKGYMDAKSATKLKRMAKAYPDIKVVLVDRTVYADMRRRYQHSLPGWESHPKHI